ncbi:MAG: DUF1343 domain-containing protein [Chloroflexota bacterium]
MLKVGIDVLQASNFEALIGKRVGLFTNPSAVNAEMVTSYQSMVDAEQVNLVALFGAEHGLFGAVQDGETIDNMVDSATGIPIRSLYGNQYRPSAEMLADIDVMVCDIQDIGVRYYTYQWTMTHVIEACGEHGIPVIVLDRPNPLGDVVAGRSLQEGISSLVGRFNVPNQHGMTIGEMMQLCNAKWNPNPAELTVISCEDYQRTMTWDAVGRPFIPPSPNMPHLSTVQHYVGSCLIEGTNLSEGRGTTLPFEIVGAPFIDGRLLASELNALNLPDVRFRPHAFMPSVRKFANEVCDGVQVHIMGEDYDPLLTWLHVIYMIKAMYPDEFGWLPPYQESDYPMFDKLIGSDKPRQLLDDGASVDEVIQGWNTDVQAFRAMREPYLIY